MLLKYRYGLNHSTRESVIFIRLASLLHRYCGRQCKWDFLCCRTCTCHIEINSLDRSLLCNLVRISSSSGERGCGSDCKV